MQRGFFLHVIVWPDAGGLVCVGEKIHILVFPADSAGTSSHPAPLYWGLSSYACLDIVDSPVAIFCYTGLEKICDGK
jgi:hypothetical protein